MADENTSESSQVPQESTKKPENKMNQNAIILGVVLVIAIVVGFVSFMTYKNKSNSEVMTTDNATDSMTNESESTLNSTESATQKMNDEKTTNTGDSVSVSVEGGNFYFKPNTINAKVGQTVKVTLNAVSMQHDFVIDALNVKSATIQSGKSTTVEFVPTKAGSFEFYCSVGNHKQMGMVGTLIVEN